MIKYTWLDWWIDTVLAFFWWLIMLVASLVAIGIVGGTLWVMFQLAVTIWTN